MKDSDSDTQLQPSQSQVLSPLQVLQPLLPLETSTYRPVRRILKRGVQGGLSNIRDGTGRDMRGTSRPVPPTKIRDPCAHQYAGLHEDLKADSLDKQGEHMHFPRQPNITRLW